VNYPPDSEVRAPVVIPSATERLHVAQNGVRRRQSEVAIIGMIGGPSPEVETESCPRDGAILGHEGVGAPTVTSTQSKMGSWFHSKLIDSCISVRAHTRFFPQKCPKNEPTSVCQRELGR
jgi:hypothetical protein